MFEVGCGLEPLFTDYTTYERMTVVEPSRFFDEKAQMSAADTRVSNKVRIIFDFIENASAMLLEDKEVFDFIVVSGLLHEVDEPKVLLNAVKNLCSANTTVYISAPMRNPCAA